RLCAALRVRMDSRSRANTQEAKVQALKGIYTDLLKMT
ncbi:MAG: hypothetical protein ACI9ZV_000580, partial [Candidatus Azotimanducaceae bacterium]